MYSLFCGSGAAEAFLFFNPEALADGSAEEVEALGAEEVEGLPEAAALI